MMIMKTLHLRIVSRLLFQRNPPPFPFILDAYVPMYVPTASASSVPWTRRCT